MSQTRGSSARLPRRPPGAASRRKSSCPRINPAPRRVWPCPRAGCGPPRSATPAWSHWTNSQPLVHHGRARTVALGHNGNLVNAAELREKLAEDGVRLTTTSDTEVIAALISNDPAPLDEAVAHT